jgi:hypothetical protein
MNSQQGTSSAAQSTSQLMGMSSSVSSTNLQPLMNNGLSTNQPANATSLSIPPSTSISPLMSSTTANSNSTGATSALPNPASTATSNNTFTSLATSITANKVSSLLKLEKKTKLALDEYKSSIDKYNNVRAEYERKLAVSADHFQCAEETHLKQMRAFVDTYSRALASANAQKQSIYTEFATKFAEHFTNEYLIHTFIESKRTGGPDRPEPATFIEYIDYVSRDPLSLSIGSGKSLSSSNMPSTSTLITPATQSGVVSPVNLLNENEFNLIINGMGSTSTSTATSSTTVNNANSAQNGMFPPPVPPLDLSDVTSLSGKEQQRSTPTFFGGSNLYSQLTNSTTTLNSISTTTQLVPPLQLNTTATAPPGTGSSASPNNQTKEATAASEKKADSGGVRSGLNIFNVDFLGRNKAKKAAAAAAAQKDTTASTAAAATTTSASTTGKASKFSRGNKKSKQASTNSATSGASGAANQYENLNLNNTSNRDSSSLNSEDSNERTANITNELTPPSVNKLSGGNNNNSSNINASLDHNLIAFTSSTSNMGGNNNGSVTARSISSITGSLSFDLLDQLKINGGGNSGGNGGMSDIDSEGFSIRPPDSSSIGKYLKII